MRAKVIVPREEEEEGGSEREMLMLKGGREGCSGRRRRIAIIRRICIISPLSPKSMNLPGENLRPLPLSRHSRPPKKYISAEAPPSVFSSPPLPPTLDRKREQPLFLDFDLIVTKH